MKRIFSVFAATMLITVCFSQVAYASADVGASVEKTNVQIDRMIDNAVFRADNAGQSTDLITSKLIKVTDHKAKVLESWAAKKGYIVESEYVEVEIGGNSILVDPCRVVGM